MIKSKEASFAEQLSCLHGYAFLMAETIEGIFEGKIVSEARIEAIEREIADAKKLEDAITKVNKERLTPANFKKNMQEITVAVSSIGEIASILKDCPKEEQNALLTNLNNVCQAIIRKTKPMIEELSGPNIE